MTLAFMPLICIKLIFQPFPMLQKLEYPCLYMTLCFPILFIVKCKYFKGYFDSINDKSLLTAVVCFDFNRCEAIG